MHKRCERRAVDGKDHTITRTPTAHRRVRAEPGRSEHRDVDTLIRSALQGKSRTCHHVPSERRPHPQPKVRKLERDSPGASSGSEQQKNPARSAMVKLPRASLRAKGRSPTKSTQAERDRPGARFGSEHPDLWREAPRLKLPRASLWAKGRSRGAPQRQPTSLMSRCHSLPSLTRTAEPSCR